MKKATASGFRKIRHLLELIVFLAISSPIALLPLGLSIRAGELIGLFAYYLLTGRRRIALENLRAAVERGALRIPDSWTPEDVVRESFSNMGRYLSEIVKVYFGLGDGIIRDVQVEGLEHHEKARARGKGVIFVTGHCGNWELWALTLPTMIGRAWGVARRQSNPYVDWFIVKARERYGGSVIFKEGALRKTISVLRQGGTVGVVMDQAVLRKEGVLVDFLGAPAWTTRLPAALARKTSAAVIPTFIYRKDKGYVIRIHPEVELPGEDAADTRIMTEYVEGYIRENPSRWLWVHRRWKHTSKRSDS
jgi:KDO2-lipid IV(A) lauroyltransferase